MADLKCIGRLGKVSNKGKNNEYVSFGVAEPSYKKDNEYVTPWFNFLVKSDSPIAKFLLANVGKIDVVEVQANERQVVKNPNTPEAKTEFFHNVRAVNVITWKKKADGTDDVPATSGGAEEEYPWSQSN